MKALFTLLCFTLLLSCSNSLDLLEKPEVGDIYIFEENDIYYPVLVDSVNKNVIYCVNSKFKFVDAVPEISDLPKEDFDFSFHLIYQKSELVRLGKENAIIEVYRNR